MKWPRDVWLDAVVRSDVVALERLVAWVYSRRAGPSDVVWLGTADLVEDTKLSRNTARRALRGLVDAGWLVLVERERQQRPARYRLVIPSAQGVTSAPSQGVSSAPPEMPGGHLRTPSGGQLLTPGGAELTPGGHLRTPNHVELEEPPPSTALDELWLVVESTLPRPLSAALTRSRRIDGDLGRLVEYGWTADALADHIEGRSWDGSGPGAVVTWLAGLPSPSTTERQPARPPWCGRCDEHTRQREDPDGRPYRCPVCHADPARLAS